MGLWLDRGRECDNLHQAIEIQIIHYLCGTDSPVSVALNTPLDRPIDRALRGFFIRFCYPSVTRPPKWRLLVTNKPIYHSELQPILERSNRFCIENTESPLVELGNKLNSTTYTEVISLYSKSNITRHKLFKKIDSFKKSEFKVDDIKEVLDTNYKRLKPLLTDTSVMSKSPPDIEVKRGKITYSPERIVEIQENLQTIQDEFFKLKIIINRA